MSNTARRPLARGDPGEEDTTDHKEILRRLALSDERFIETELGIGLDTVEVSRLDAKTHALVRLAAALAIDAARAPTSPRSSRRWPPAPASTRSSGR